MAPRLDALTVLRHLAAARAVRHRDRAALEAAQRRRLERFLARVLPRAPYYAHWAGKPLEALPIADKVLMMGEFDGFNTRGIRREEALEVALRAERSRDFRPALGDVTVGLSSGTSGNRGLFLVSDAERLRWAGLVLARMLPQRLLARLLSPWRAPLRIAFFLRANSNLYTALSSSRLELDYFDLLEPLERHITRLADRPPDVLVAPASVLRILALRALDGGLRIAPRHVVSVAEVLEADDVPLIESAFGQPVHQLYQCTEGFLGYTCALGGLHLNEVHVHMEPEWLDADRTRFVPIVTDFSRETQLIVRYRLNDVLRVGEPCRCGNPERTLAAIEGRTDDVLWLPDASGRGMTPVFPDFVRRAMLLAGDAVRDYRVRQQGDELEIALESDAVDDARVLVERELGQLWRALDVRSPHLRFMAMPAPVVGAKRRRVECVGASQASTARADDSLASSGRTALCPRT
jgi:putative adenylate-forming enzyme